MVSVLVKPEETRNRYLYVTSVTTTRLERLATYEKLIGVRLEVEENKGTAELERVSNEAIAKGGLEVGWQIFRTIYAEGFGGKLRKGG